MRKLPPRRMSFKEAASELGVTPTAISHQIRSLENICGQRLFRRRPRPLALTGAGERLFPIVRARIDTFAAAFAALSPSGGQRQLRVTSPNAFASRWLVPRLPKWRERHPKISLEIIGTDAALDLRAGTADIAIRYARRMPADLVAQEIFRDAFVPACRPDLLARGARRIERAAPSIDTLRLDEPGPRRANPVAMACHRALRRSRHSGHCQGLGPELP